MAQLETLAHKGAQKSAQIHERHRDAHAEQPDFCDTLTDEQDEFAREILSRAANKWSIWIMHVLAENREPMRFSRIQDEVEGISHKILTQCLRRLEGDGLVTRTVYPEVPPRVEYRLTALGLELLQQLVPLWRWVCERITLFEKAAD